MVWVLDGEGGEWEMALSESLGRGRRRRRQERVGRGECQDTSKMRDILSEISASITSTSSSGGTSPVRHKSSQAPWCGESDSNDQ
jgi:hypothetical protein